MHQKWIWNFIVEQSKICLRIKSFYFWILEVTSRQIQELSVWDHILHLQSVLWLDTYCSETHAFQNQTPWTGLGVGKEVFPRNEHTNLLSHIKWSSLKTCKSNIILTDQVILRNTHSHVFVYSKYVIFKFTYTYMQAITIPGIHKDDPS